MINNFIDDRQATIDAAETVESHPASVRELFTFETGLVLETLGKMFVNIPPFNDHIDRNTGQMLISIGKKLKGSR
ncbi:MAG: hypothetical protein HY864_10735 [Chloroflexi bacterium]|nr:hypothetical protein [Chloroflexota bacterium]